MVMLLRSGVALAPPAEGKLRLASTVPSTSASSASTRSETSSDDEEFAASVRGSCPRLDFAEWRFVELPAGLVVKKTFIEVIEGQSSLSHLPRSRSMPCIHDRHAHCEQDADTVSQPAKVLSLAAVVPDTRPQAKMSLGHPAFDARSPVTPFTLGNPQMPSLGSEGHATGQCQPCAFFWKAGCGNGTLCEFCHLCGPEEKKRRQKEKKLSFKARRTSCS